MDKLHLTGSLGVLNLETTAVPSTDQGDQRDNASDDAWYDDGCMGESSDADAELNREQKRRHDHFYTMGYRDGISAGKEASAQEGFNIGFKQSAPDGYKWGLVRGITSAFAGLPDPSKERLVKQVEDRDKFYSLYGSVQEISADDALKLYYRQLPQNSQSDQKSEEDLDCNKLDILFKDLTSLVSEASEIKLSAEQAKANLNV